MSCIFFLATLLALQLSGADNLPSPVITTSRKWCDTPLCKGLVGAAAGALGAAGVGILVSQAVQAAHPNTPEPVHTTKWLVDVAGNRYPTVPPNLVGNRTVPTTSTEAPALFRENEDKGGNGSSSSLPMPILLAIGLLLCCCGTALVIGLFMKPTAKRSTKVKPTRRSSSDRSVEVPEVTPLISTGGQPEQAEQFAPMPMPDMFAAPASSMYAPMSSMYAPAQMSSVYAPAHMPSQYSRPALTPSLYAPSYTRAPSQYAPVYATAPGAMF